MASAIEGFTPTVSNTGKKKSKSFNDISGEDFINIMVTQLQQQDPLDPSKSDQLLTQLSQIKALESNTALTTNLNGLTLQQGIGSAGNLIGKKVDGITEDGEDTEGTVTSVSVKNKKVYLELDNGTTLPLENITNIAQAPASEAASALSKLANMPGLSGLNNANDLISALSGS